MGGVALADGVSGGVDGGDQPPEEPSKASLPVTHTDREGNEFSCIVFDHDMGCLYAVEQYTNGFMLYFVSPDGDRYRHWIPSEMVAADPHGRHTERPTHYYPTPCPSY